MISGNSRFMLFSLPNVTGYLFASLVAMLGIIVTVMISIIQKSK